MDAVPVLYIRVKMSRHLIALSLGLHNRWLTNDTLWENEASIEIAFWLVKPG